MAVFHFPDDPREAARVFNEIRAEYLVKLGIEFEEISRERVVALMPVEGNTQRFGPLHGGATTSLVETLASVGAEVVLGKEERAIMGQDQTCHFLSVALSGKVRGIATPLHLGRTTQVWDVNVSAETGKRVAAGRVTIAVREVRK
jgi:uncharacterized protein (TIGR00369 family)